MKCSPHVVSRKSHRCVFCGASDLDILLKKETMVAAKQTTPDNMLEGVGKRGNLPSIKDTPLSAFRNTAVQRIETGIEIKTRFEALHHWPNAPEEVSFLRHPHRHEFHVKVSYVTSHGDREIEFFMEKKKINEFIINQGWTAELTTNSCEQFARTILDEFIPRGAWCVEVSEDGDNIGYAMMLESKEGA